MKRKEIFEKFRDIVVKVLNVDKEDVTEEAMIGDELGADSLDEVDLLIRTEKVFGVRIPDDEIPAYFDHSVSECVNLIVRKRKEKGLD